MINDEEYWLIGLEMKIIIKKMKLIISCNFSSESGFQKSIKIKEPWLLLILDLHSLAPARSNQYKKDEQRAER